MRRIGLGSPRHPAEHHRLRLLLLVLLLLAILAARIEGQSPAKSLDVRRAADTTRQLRVVISVAKRHLWVLDSLGDTLLTAPAAVGSGRRLTLGRKTWRFETPVGVRSVLSTETDPVWIRPDWSYLELAKQRKLRLDSVTSTRPRPLANGDTLVVRASEIGRLHDGTFTAWPYEKDIVIGGVLYMPPLGSPYRLSRGTLGKYRLNLGDAVGVHGTLEKESIGKAVTHGCVRLSDADIEWLYLNVPVGTPVFIY